MGQWTTKKCMRPVKFRIPHSRIVSNNPGWVELGVYPGKVSLKALWINQDDQGWGGVPVKWSHCEGPGRRGHPWGVAFHPSAWGSLYPCFWVCCHKITLSGKALLSSTLGLHLSLLKCFENTNFQIGCQSYFIPRLQWDSRQVCLENNPCLVPFGRAELREERCNCPDWVWG